MLTLDDFIPVELRGEVEEQMRRAAPGLLSSVDARRARNMAEYTRARAGFLEDAEDADFFEKNPNIQMPVIEDALKIMRDVMEATKLSRGKDKRVATMLVDFSG